MAAEESRGYIRQQADLLEKLMAEVRAHRGWRRRTGGKAVCALKAILQRQEPHTWKGATDFINNLAHCLRCQCGPMQKPAAAIHSKSGSREQETPVQSATDRLDCRHPQPIRRRSFRVSPLQVLPKVKTYLLENADADATAVVDFHPPKELLALLNVALPKEASSTDTVSLVLLSFFFLFLKAPALLRLLL